MILLQYQAKTHILKGNKKMENREIIDSKKLKTIYNYISTMKNGKQIKMMFQFSYSGLRLCSWFKLQLKDILTPNNEIKDIISLTGEKIKGSKEKLYYVSEEMKKNIREYIKGWDLTDRERYLFVSQKTLKPYNKNALTNLFHKIYKELGIENCATHLGRRTFCTSLLIDGVDLNSVKELMGHSFVSTTSLYYNKNDNYLKSVVNNHKI